MTVWEDTCCAFHFIFVRSLLVLHDFSTELDAEKRLALQEEKQALEAKLLEV
jgi:hypothetical protein